MTMSSSRRKTLYDKLKEVKNAEDACTKDHKRGGAFRLLTVVFGGNSRSYPFTHQKPLEKLDSGNRT